MSATELASRIQADDLSSADVVRAHIARLEEVNGDLNAVVVRLYDEAVEAAENADAMRARGESLGPLHGVPITIKEQFLVRGTPSTWGLVHRKDHRATVEGTLVTRLREAGAIPIAKTNVPQLLISHETDNPLYGRTQNPWDLERTPGGSSGGEAALIASHASPLGLGSDLGGSVRVPCHMTGLHGLKPTTGRLPMDDMPPDIMRVLETIMPQPGPMARHVSDLVVAMEVLVGTPPSGPTLAPVPWADPEAVKIKGLRIAVQLDDGFFMPSPAMRRAVREAADALSDMGVQLLDWNPRVGGQVFDHFVGLLGADGFQAFRDALQGDAPHPLIARILQTSRAPRAVARRLGAPLRALGQERLARVASGVGKVSIDDYLQRLHERYVFREVYAAQMRAQRIDAVLCPPYGLPAPRHGKSPEILDAASYAFAFNVLGMPAGVVSTTRVQPGEESDRPESRDTVERAAGRVEEGSQGLPVGVQVAAPWWREDTVLRVMAALEQHARKQPDYPRLPIAPRAPDPSEGADDAD